MKILPGCFQTETGTLQINDLTHFCLKIFFHNVMWTKRKHHHHTDSCVLLHMCWSKINFSPKGHFNI